MGCALSVGAEQAPPRELRLAQELDAEGDHVAAAVAFRRLAALEADAITEGRWLWLAAYEYARANEFRRSNHLLDRAEDLAPLEVEYPAAWLRAENALARRDWGAAIFHFESFGAATDDPAVRLFAARAAASAHLSAGDLAAARHALREDERVQALDRYSAGKDKRVWLGGLLGVIPGFGYFYSGEIGNGVRSMILNGLFIWGMRETAHRSQWGTFAAISFFEVTWYTGSIYGGIDAAKRHNAERLMDTTDAIRGSEHVVPALKSAPLISLNLVF
jgi:hypothetical protein